ncbi:MAG: M28 family peptidase [Bacteroidales bacterium]|nr:M28 family peptidase [Bacteroidales bacterium]MCF8402300.1 M28 family peptidase [Bacteroidales bacterium]
MRILFTLIAFLFIINSSFAQSEDEITLRQIFDNVLESDVAYNNLAYLCHETPGRLLGSDESIAAIDYMKSYFETLGADSVFLQEFKTPAWKCRSTAVSIIKKDKKIRLRADALGPSPATTDEGIIANVIEVQGLEELKKLGEEAVSGKIVFYNRPVNRKLVNTFRVYGSAIDQRYYGPALAAELGAVGVLVRSVSTRTDTFPHTGSTQFEEKKIPCAAISTVDADILSQHIKENKDLQLSIRIDAEDLPEITSYNLIADIKGSEFPEEYIVVGGHIDAWFNSPGAHDDGIGCVQSADVLRIFKELGLKNKRTIRAIMFMDEELYQSGGNAYAQYSEINNIKNYIALEADAGGFTPEGFTVDASDSIYSIISGFKGLLEPYGIHYIKKGGSGVDINPLKKSGVPLMGYRTDSQRYMDIHHSAWDSFDKVSIRELQLGSGCMAGILFLVDKYGY